MMDDAPERIWAGNWLADVGETSVWDIGEWRDEPWQTVDTVEYIRATDYDALVAKLDAADARIAHLENHIEGVAKDTHKIMVDLATPLDDPRVAALEKRLLDTAASLAAAISLLERGGKKAAASDKMFAQMIVDYNASLDRARAALSALEENK